MQNTFDQLLERFKLTRADYNYLKSLDEEKSSALQTIIEETYNANGQLVVQKYLANTREMDGLMVDHIIDGGVEAAVYNNPYRLNIFIPDYPPRLREHNKTKFSKNLGYDTNKRWFHYMSCALHELRAKGAVTFAEKIIVIAKYHFPRDCYNVDNFAINFINNILRLSGLIRRDDYTHLSVLSCGVTDKEKKGLEITIISQNDFNNDPLFYLE